MKQEHLEGWDRFSALLVSLPPQPAQILKALADVLSLIRRVLGNNALNDLFQYIQQFSGELRHKLRHLVGGLYRHEGLKQLLKQGVGVIRFVNSPSDPLQKDWYSLRHP